MISRRRRRRSTLMSRGGERDGWSEATEIIPLSYITNILLLAPCPLLTRREFEGCLTQEFQVVEGDDSSSSDDDTRSSHPNPITLTPIPDCITLKSDRLPLRNDPLPTLLPLTLPPQPSLLPSNVRTSDYLGIGDGVITLGRRMPTRGEGNRWKKRGKGGKKRGRGGRIDEVRRDFKKHVQACRCAPPVFRPPP